MASERLDFEPQYATIAGNSHTPVATTLQADTTSDEVEHK